MQQSTRVYLSNESIYGEAKTLAEWIEWLTQKFAAVPQEYRESAILEIDSISGYEGEHHTEAHLYFDRPEMPQEAVRRKAQILARAVEAEGLARHWLQDAERLHREADAQIVETIEPFDLLDLDARQEIASAIRNKE